MQPNYLFPFHPNILSGFFGVIGVIAILDIVLKGIALWKAGRNNQSYWFVALLILNTAGILPLLYILFFQKPKNG